MSGTFAETPGDAPSPSDELPAEGTPSSLLMTVAPPSRLPPLPFDEILALERDPGATLAIPQVEVRAGPPHPKLSGSPGPSPALGPKTAPVKVFVFSDFQCPVCRRVVEPLKQLARAYPDEVQIVFKHHALETHRRAAQAAVASIAAFRQGKFWEYHDLLFQNQRFLDEADLLRYAEALDLDVARFRRDMADPAAAAQVAYESEMADALGARGTPGFFVNGTRLLGWGSYQGFQSTVERALREARRLASEGMAAPDVAVEATLAAGAPGKLVAEFLWGVSRE